MGMREDHTTSAGIVASSMDLLMTVESVRAIHAVTVAFRADGKQRESISRFPAVYITCVAVWMAENVSFMRG